MLFPEAANFLPRVRRNVVVVNAVNLSRGLVGGPRHKNQTAAVGSRAGIGMSSWGEHVGALDPLLPLSFGWEILVHCVKVAIPFVLSFLTSHDKETFQALSIVRPGIHDVVAAERNVIL